MVETVYMKYFSFVKNILGRDFASRSNKNSKDSAKYLFLSINISPDFSDPENHSRSIALVLSLRHSNNLGFQSYRSMTN